MTNPRLFLVAPDAIANDLLVACALAACKTGDCACIVAPHTIDQASVASLQGAGLAVLLRDCEVRLVHHLKADGLHLTDAVQFAEARKALDNHSVGLAAGTSRHAAMEAAEAGADYVAFTQSKQFAGEPILGWWHDVTDVPSVAFDPVTAETVASLLPQKPDFIRPSDDMWQGADSATRIVAELAKAVT